MGLFCRLLLLQLKPRHVCDPHVLSELCRAHAFMPAKADKGRHLPKENPFVVFRAPQGRWEQAFADAPNKVVDLFV